MYKCGGNLRKSKSGMADGGGDMSYLNDCGDFHRDCKLFTRMIGCEDNAWLKVTCRDTCGTCGKLVRVL